TLFNSSMKRLRLLRRFFPNCEQYRSQGYGHLSIGMNAQIPDETHKNIPISNFPIQWLVDINSIFKALGEQSLRPETWEAYTQAVIDLRRTNLQILQQLSDGLAIYFRRQGMTQILGNFVESDLWRHLRQLLEFFPLLPRCAFDEWGFITENKNRTAGINQRNFSQKQDLALEKYQSYIKALNKYFRVCSNFYGQAEWVLNFHPHIRNGEDDQVEKITQSANLDLKQQAHLSVFNLGDAWQALPELQKEFRKLLAQFIDTQELDDLEYLEREIFKSLWCSWYFFAFCPTRRFSDARHECLQRFDKKVKEIEKSIKHHLRAIASENLQVGILSKNEQWEEQESLWLKIDGEDVFEVYGAIEGVVIAIQKAINSVHSNELRRYAIDFTWSNIVVVPLVQGKSLDSTARLFPLFLFSLDPNREINQCYFAPVTIPSNTFSQLELSKWNHPRLTVAQKLVSSISQLSLLLSHLQDFARLPESDEQREELLQQYLRRSAVPLNETLEAYDDAIVEIVSYFTNLSSPEETNRPYLCDAVKILAELHKHILPTTDSSVDGIVRGVMELEEIGEWAERLTEVQQQIVCVYLYLVSDVLEKGG
ncbi:MAG: hypothetical protein WBG70_07725, partial [Spirulinaceae cyanobacterium]